MGPVPPRARHRRALRRLGLLWCRATSGLLSPAVRDREVDRQAPGIRRSPGSTRSWATSSARCTAPTTTSAPSICRDTSPSSPAGLTADSRCARCFPASHSSLCALHPCRTESSSWLRIMRNQVRCRRHTLVCVAPPEYKRCLEHALNSAGTSIVSITRSTLDLSNVSISVSHRDPYNIIAIAEEFSGKSDGVILVVPKQSSPRRVLPAPVLCGLPVGLLLSDHPSDLACWLHALSKEESRNSTSAVLSMNASSYEHRGRLFASWLRSVECGRTVTWFSDTVTRKELCKRLAKGLNIVVYVGHGRARGLSGYMGLRWRHVVEVPKGIPVGAFICFACDTVKRERGCIPFGCKWVMAGRALAYVGSVEEVSVRANARLVDVFGTVLGSSCVDNLGCLLKNVDVCIRADEVKYAEALEAFCSYRVIGNPVQGFCDSL